MYTLFGSVGSTAMLSPPWKLPSGRPKPSVNAVQLESALSQR
jgi:hypothetical protein